MRERIIETATAMFVEKGYDAVAMREISDGCGITKAALYYHFASKAQLLYSVVNGYLDENARVLEAAVAEGGTYSEQVRRIVRGLFDVRGEQRAILRLAMHYLDRLEPADRERFDQEYADRFVLPMQKIFTDGAASGEFRTADPELWVWFLLGIAYPFFGMPGSTSTPTDPHTVEELLNVFLHGLCGPID